MYRYFHIALLVVSGFLITGVNTYAQDAEKREVEKRIKKGEMPDAALAYLDEHWLDQSRKIRFYYETDGEGASYEAKLTREGRRFSIEFDEAGTLQDIEELVDYEKIPTLARTPMDSTLNSAYKKYKVQRIQQQYLPDSTNRNLPLQFSMLIPENTNNYELEIDVRESDIVQSYEILFDAYGQLVQRRVIVRRSLDNFLY